MLLFLLLDIGKCITNTLLCKFKNSGIVYAGNMLLHCQRIPAKIGIGTLILSIGRTIVCRLYTCILLLCILLRTLLVLLRSRYILPFKRRVRMLSCRRSLWARSQNNVPSAGSQASAA